ncbi:hypothetical protein H257_09245 [Aphanomyces astaci]|uniref:Uncharacterized protein n=1 Tax=Aphanomyces astaci TaxID=112090 RepID=W4GAS6_APHAT|nr:hypothetical protein H257_09245 [Aphanomyces astaci]ETV76792.1 hypothetical protein H257_09245 [Aphanomyces astaci]|eukprot:XP_009833704.1 hypothetical protein H257_09245 [Aphanomyces astaci]
MIETTQYGFVVIGLGAFHAVANASGGMLLHTSTDPSRLRTRLVPLLAIHRVVRCLAMCDASPTIPLFQGQCVLTLTVIAHHFYKLRLVASAVVPTNDIDEPGYALARPQRTAGGGMNCVVFQSSMSNQLVFAFRGTASKQNVKTDLEISPSRPFRGGHISQYHHHPQHPASSIGSAVR